jgi:hypothetical protein
MVRYFYAWTSLVIVGAVVLLSLPWLGLIALMAFSLLALAAVAALAWAIFFVPYVLGRAISRRWHIRSGASARTAAALAPARGQTPRTARTDHRATRLFRDVNQRQRRAATMSTLEPTTRLMGSAAVSPRPSGAIGESTVAAERDALFVIAGRGGGLRASIRGHLLELAERSLDHRLGPTPDDLFIASIASDLAWSARHFLHAHGLPDEVSVSAEWRRLEIPASLADVNLTVTLPETADAMSDALQHVLAARVGARSLDEPPRLNLRCAG